MPTVGWCCWCLGVQGGLASLDHAQHSQDTGCPVLHILLVHKPGRGCQYYHPRYQPHLPRATDCPVLRNLKPKMWLAFLLHPTSAPPPPWQTDCPALRVLLLSRPRGGRRYCHTPHQLHLPRPTDIPVLCTGHVQAKRRLIILSRAISTAPPPSK